MSWDEAVFGRLGGWKIGIGVGTAGGWVGLIFGVDIPLKQAGRAFHLIPGVFARYGRLVTC